MRRITSVISAAGILFACCGASPGSLRADEAIVFAVEMPDVQAYMMLDSLIVRGSAVTGAGLGATSGIKPLAAPAYYNVSPRTGQSLGLGFINLPVLSTTETLGNLAPHCSTLDYPCSGVWSLVSCAAPIRTLGSSAYPANINGEVPDNAKVDELTTLATAAGVSPMITVYDTTGEGGQACSVIKKGGTGNQYAAGIAIVTAVHAIAVSQGKTDAVLDIPITEGEADSPLNGNATVFGACMTQLQSDYQTDSQAITHQTSPVPLMMGQQNGEPATGSFQAVGNLDGNIVATQQITAMNASTPTNPILISGPEYQLLHGSDNLHLLSGTDEQQMGEKEAEVEWSWIKHLAGQGPIWKPLGPTAFGTASSNITVSDSTITIPLDVPDGPVVRDLSYFATHPHQTKYPAWANGGGIEFFDHLLPGNIQSCTGTATPIVVTMTSNLPAWVATGQTYAILFAGAGDVATEDYLDKTWTITVTGAATFSLNGSTGQTQNCLVNNYGTVVHTPTISTAVASGNSIVVTTSGPVGADSGFFGFSYAHISEGSHDALAGGYVSGTGRYGEWRDSHAATGLKSGRHLYNWLSTFFVSITVPRLTSASSVSHTGGTSSIVGTGLVAGCSATIDGAAAAITCSSATAASLTVPATAAGTHTVVITNPSPNPANSGTSGTNSLTTT